MSKTVNLIYLILIIFNVGNLYLIYLIISELKSKLHYDFNIINCVFL